jgi:adenosylcobalamin-dependent ribonucleoside-triphosphate reductase
MERFRLTEDFLAKYKDVEPPFGFNGLGYLVYMRTYSRIKADGKNEVWWETIRRVVEGTYNMQKNWIEINSLGWNPQKAQFSAQEMYDRMFHMKFLPPGRGLWAMGSPLTEARGCFAALNNCGLTTTAYMNQVGAEPFCFLMDASMLGVGVGFDTRGAGTLTIHKPRVHLSETLIIPDSREGWVDSVRRLLNSYFRGSATVEFDYSEIRPAGAPIKGFGGVASGPEPLMKLHDDLRELLDSYDCKEVSKRLIVDIMNMIGKCVVAGNVRRTAEIALDAGLDPEYLRLKDYEANPERAAFGWASNNSVMPKLGSDYNEVAKYTALNGEPGFQWLENIRAYSRMNGDPDYKDKRADGCNPCGEQSLEGGMASGELCCLAETFPHRNKDLADYKRTLKFAYLYAKTVTLGKTHWPETNRILLRNRRIGASMSGIVQFVSAQGLHILGEWANEGYKTLEYYDEIYSDWLCVPRSIKMTSIKPSGTVSLLAGATPGIHFPESRFYIRRMRLDNKSNLIPTLIESGYTVEPCIGQEESTVVVEIPVKIEENIRTVSEVSMWEQLALAAFMQKNWADNQVSCTITFDPDTEGDQIANALNYYQYQLKGVSFLPRTKKGAFPQMPYEAITEAQYEAMAANLKPLNFDKVTGEKADVECFCSNDHCEIGAVH